MDEMSVIEARRDANLANLRRAFQAPAAGELPTTFASLLSRLSEKCGAGMPSARSQPNRSQGA